MEQESGNIEVTSGSPLPGVKVIMIETVLVILCRVASILFCCFESLYLFLFVAEHDIIIFPKYPEQPQELGEFERIPKETIDILKDQVFGFDTYFVTGQEPYEVS